MKKEELNKMLDVHKLWLESEGEKGNPAYLEGFDLEGINLSGVNLANANLAGANLTGANLSGCYLIETNLEDVNLTGADLEYADMEGSKLVGAIFMTELKDVADLSYCEVTKDQLPWLAMNSEYSDFYSTLNVS